MVEVQNNFFQFSSFPRVFYVNIIYTTKLALRQEIIWIQKWTLSRDVF